MAVVEIIVGGVVALLGALIREAVKAGVGEETFLSKYSTADEVCEEIKKIYKDLAAIQVSVREAERRHRRTNDEEVANWIERAREAAQKIEDIVDDFVYSTAPQHGVGFRAFAGSIGRYPQHRVIRRATARQLRDLRPEVKEIQQKLDNLRPACPSSSSGHRDHVSRSQQTGGDYLSVNTVVGFEEEEARLIRWSTTSPPGGGRTGAEDDPRRLTISVVGMGGLGKTTLVRKVYENQRMKEHFHLRAWVSVSKSYDRNDVLRTMARELRRREEEGIAAAEGGIGATHDESSSSDLVVNLRRLLGGGKRYVVVFDDVWRRDFWDGVGCAFPRSSDPGSRILITTRDSGVATHATAEPRRLHLGVLPDAAAWSLFCRTAFWDEPAGGDLVPGAALGAWARRIVGACEGLPLAIVCVGNLLRLRGRDPAAWESFHRSLRFELTGKEERMTDILMTSFEDLPHHLKRCIVYCSIFPEDYRIKRKRLIRLLVAEDCAQGRDDGSTAEDVAEGYVNELVSRSMLQVAETNETGQRVKSYRLHDLVRMLALSISEKENFHMVYDSGNAAGAAQPAAAYTRARILSVHKTIEEGGDDHQLLSADLQRLRSLSVFVNRRRKPLLLPARLKLLRVLDLTGAPIRKIPDQVFDLFLLRYLGLRSTKVTELSGSVEKLQNLQTLDLWGSHVKELPREVLKLPGLRHLFMYGIDAGKLSYHNYHRSREAPSGLWDMKNLQTLKTVRANEELVSRLHLLRQLRTLSVIKTAGLQNEELLYKAIGEMTHLRRLSVIAAPRSPQLRLERLQPPRGLQKLVLSGRLREVPSWFSHLGSLTHLYLFGSGLPGDPLPYLRGLPFLVLLVLDDAFVGETLSLDREGFRGLRILYLRALPSLKLVKLENGAVPKLCKLYLCDCPSLKTVDLGESVLNSLSLLWLRKPHKSLLADMKTLKGSGTLRAEMRHVE